LLILLFLFFIFLLLFSNRVYFGMGGAESAREREIRVIDIGEMQRTG
jgi:hypothetical protein